MRPFILREEDRNCFEYLKTKTVAGGRPNITHLAKKWDVSRNSIYKVEHEIYHFGRLLSPSEIIDNRKAPVGPGALTTEQLCSQEKVHWP